MKKIIITSLLFTCLMTACHNKPKEQVFEKNLKINEQIVETNKSADNEMNTLQDEPKIAEDKLNNVESQTELIESNGSNNYEPQGVTDSNYESVNNFNEIDEVDTSNIDYPIHRGRIDCYNENECMNISIPIQFKYKQSIANVFYLEVISQNDNILGYFIEYNFKENKYSSQEECISIGSEIKSVLSNKVIDYECFSDGVLKIKTDYGKE